MIDFLIPLIFAFVGGNKHFCNKYCGRGQLFTVLGKIENVLWVAQFSFGFYSLILEKGDINEAKHKESVFLTVIFHFYIMKKTYDV